MIQNMKCQKCGGEFEATEVGGGMTSKELEPLKCPHCGFTRMALCSGRWMTRPLPKQDEFSEAPPKRDA